MKKQKRLRRRSGTLGVLAGLLIASAVLRSASSGSLAFAETIKGMDANDGMESELAASPPTTNSELFEALQEREARLEERELQVMNRLQAINLAEVEIKDQLAALIDAEEKLRSTIALADAAAVNDLQSLTQVYENMKPKDAAALFEEMSPEFAAGFLGLMRADAAALIMTGLEPTTAYSISVILAGRNANVPVSGN